MRLVRALHGAPVREWGDGPIGIDLGKESGSSWVVLAVSQRAPKENGVYTVSKTGVVQRR